MHWERFFLKPCSFIINNCLSGSVTTRWLPSSLFSCCRINSLYPNTELFWLNFLGCDSLLVSTPRTSPRLSIDPDLLWALIWAFILLICNTNLSRITRKCSSIWVSTIKPHHQQYHNYLEVHKPPNYYHMDYLRHSPVKSQEETSERELPEHDRVHTLEDICRNHLYLYCRLYKLIPSFFSFLSITYDLKNIFQKLISPRFRGTSLSYARFTSGNCLRICFLASFVNRNNFIFYYSKYIKK